VTAAHASFATPLSAELRALPAHIAERARAVFEWSASLRSIRRGAAGRHAQKGAQDTHAARGADVQSLELLACGSNDPPVWCGNVCGGTCEWVRSGQTGAASQYDVGTDFNGFHNIQHLLDRSHGCVEGGRVRVCGLLMLAREGVTACSALLSGQKIHRIPALISCASAQGQSGMSGAVPVVPLFCRAEICGKHCKTTATFFHELRLRSSNSVWSEQCAIQVRSSHCVRSIYCKTHRKAI